MNEILVFSWPNLSDDVRYDTLLSRTAIWVGRLSGWTLSQIEIQCSGSCTSWSTHTVERFDVWWREHCSYYVCFWVWMRSIYHKLFVISLHHLRLQPLLFRCFIPMALWCVLTASRLSRCAIWSRKRQGVILIYKVIESSEFRAFISWTGQINWFMRYIYIIETCLGLGIMPTLVL